jgi:hypothetical protein
MMPGRNPAPVPREKFRQPAPMRLSPVCIILAGMLKDYADRELEDIAARYAARAPLPDADIRALAHYLAHQ